VELHSARRVGLSRALSKLGYCSRSRAAELVRAGRVQVNGVVRRNPETPVKLASDHFAVDGVALATRAKSYWMMNKPRGVVTTMSDEQGRKSVADLLPPSNSWLAPVGRLDKASEGLLLLTNDSEWGARIVDPKSHVVKTYHVQIAARVEDELLSTLTKGVRINGSLWRVKSVCPLRSGEKNTWLEIHLDEGKNRQIRRIFEALQIEVLRLVRVAIGPLHLGDLPKGKTRALTSEEVSELSSAGRRVVAAR
jgi:23S rRNA pseudouridine2605 synthase